MSTNDTFLSVKGTITPLSVGISEDEYSIKIITKKSRNDDEQISVFVGKFLSDVYTRAIGLQSAIMTSIEMVIQQMYAPDFLIGPLPKLGRPGEGVIFQPDDILVSFADRNNYLIFNTFSAEREVKFITLGQPTIYYYPDSPGAPPTYTFNSTETDDTYTVSYSVYGNFTVTDQRGRVLFFDLATTPSTPVATYKTLPLTESVLVDGTKIYKSTPYTSVGITVLPNVLPVDLSTLKFAEGIVGFFHTEGEILGSQVLIDYIFTQYTFLPIVQACVTRFIRTMFNPARNSIYHVLNINNRDSFSVNTGYASFVSVHDVKLEIKVT